MEDERGDRKDRRRQWDRDGETEAQKAGERPVSPRETPDVMKLKFMLLTGQNK